MENIEKQNIYIEKETTEVKENIINEEVKDFWQDYQYWWVIQKLRPWVEVLQTKVDTTKESYFQTINWLQIIPDRTLTRLNISTVTIQKEWYFIINWIISFAYNETWIRRAILSRQTSTNIYDLLTIEAWAIAWATQLHINTIQKLYPWDLIYIDVWQNSWSGIVIIEDINFTKLNIYNIT